MTRVLVKSINQKSAFTASSVLTVTNAIWQLLDALFVYTFIWMSVTIFTMLASLLVTKIMLLHLRPNQGSITTSSLHFCVFLLCYRRWFYVTFLSGWLLKWELTFHALSGAATMTWLRVTVTILKFSSRQLSNAFVIRRASLTLLIENQFFWKAVILTIATARLWGFWAFSSVFSFLSALCN